MSSPSRTPINEAKAPPRPDTVAEAKQAARALREALEETGVTVSHAEALERIAEQNGCRDWNTLHARLKQGLPARWRPGARVSGQYLGQAFTATVLAAEALPRGWVRLALDLDTAVDVVRFDSFSNLRKRVRAVVGPEGHTRERTSDGQPHVRLDL